MKNSSAIIQIILDSAPALFASLPKGWALGGTKQFLSSEICPSDLRELSSLRHILTNLWEEVKENFESASTMRWEPSGEDGVGRFLIIGSTKVEKANTPQKLSAAFVQGMVKDVEDRIASHEESKVTEALLVEEGMALLGLNQVLFTLEVREEETQMGER